LTQAEKDLQQTKDQFTSMAESIEYNEYLFSMAKTAKLMVLNIESSEANIADISTATDTFYSTTFTINLKGKVTNILSFVDLVVKDPAFKTSKIDSITFDIPIPLTQAQKDDIKAGIKADIKASIISTIEAEHLARVTERQALWDKQLALYAEKLVSTRASVTPYAMLIYTEQAILDVLEVPYNNLTVEDMRIKILNIIGAQFGANIANQYTPDIVDAIENGVASQLIDIVANIYGQVIGEMFTAGTPELTPQFGGPLGEDITIAVKDIPPSLVGGLVTELMKTRMQAKLEETMTALAGPPPVEPSPIEPLDPLAVENTAEQQAEKEAQQKAALEIALQSDVIENSASSAVTMTVFTYKGS
jgi:hypothetical protein